MSHKKKKLTNRQREELLKTVKDRFDKNMHRHKDLPWAEIESKLKASPAKLWTLQKMEETGGEPDVLGHDSNTDEYIFFDCSPESPKGRRSVCYDRAALEARKKYKPKTSAIELANEIGIELLTEEEYRYLQKFGYFDTKTSSWLKTPADIRELGGAIFGDFRYGKVFVYHNGADSYYAARGFRGSLKI